MTRSQSLDRLSKHFTMIMKNLTNKSSNSTNSSLQQKNLLPKWKKSLNDNNSKWLNIKYNFKNLQKLHNNVLLNMLIKINKNKVIYLI